MFTLNVNMNRSGKCSGGSGPGSSSVIIPAHPEWMSMGTAQAMIVTDQGQFVDAEMLDDPAQDLADQVMKLITCYRKSLTENRLELSFHMPMIFRGISKPFELDGKTCISAEVAYLPNYGTEGVMPTYMGMNFEYISPSIALTHRVVIAPHALWPEDPSQGTIYTPDINTSDTLHSAVGSLVIADSSGPVGNRVMVRSPYGKLGPNDLSSAQIFVVLPFLSTAQTEGTLTCNMEYNWPAAISADGATLYWLGLASRVVEGENFIAFDNVFLTKDDATTLPTFLDNVAALSYGLSKL